MVAFSRESILDVLRRPLDHDWTVQGFGMLRTYLDKDKKYRINVWDQRLAVPGVSTIHDHPWHFDSLVIGGVVINQRFLQVGPLRVPDHQVFDCMRIKTGEGGGPAGPEQLVGLSRLKPEIIERGGVYHQDAHEIHESTPLDGTVTLNARERLPDGDHARVFWPHGQRWVDAEPRAALRDEIVAVIGDAFKKWRFNGE